jgi:type IX secretion system PorP/SprF family membrane protein
MKIKNISLKVAIAILVFSSSLIVNAQDIHFTQFDASPLTINPAFTGSFNGVYRVNAIYRNQWASVTTPFVTYSTSFDAPLKKDLSNSDNLAAGINLYNDRSGDGNLTNMSIIGSLAYHKFFGEDDSKTLSVGMQGGYSQKSIDLARLYWTDEFKNGGFQTGLTGEQINPKTKYFTANAGLSWQHLIGEKFSYQLGIAGYNLNQPNESLLKKANNEVGLGMRINTQIGAKILASDRISIKPAVMYQSQSSASEMIAGSEFAYMLSNTDFKAVGTSVFLGGWYRSNDALLITMGFEMKGFRVGFGYDYNISDLKLASGGNGGFDISVRYVKPNLIDLFSRKVFPCSRF